jgi:hypothetical protein
MTYVTLTMLICCFDQGCLCQAVHWLVSDQAGARSRHEDQGGKEGKAAGITYVTLTMEVVTLTVTVYVKLSFGL